MKKSEFIALLEKFERGECTPQEQDLLHRWFDEAKHDQSFLNDKELLAELKDNEYRLPVSRSKAIVFSLKRVAALAASVCLFLGITFLIHKNVLDSRTATTEQTSGYAIYPGADMAILKNKQGEILRLDSNVFVRNIEFGGDALQWTENGELDYRNKLTSPVDPSGHQLETPKGGQYSLILADGTRVVLNAGSRLEYPSHFSGGSRNVNLRGEAYFEVAKDVERPFIVSTGQGQVEVLGTRFNVRSHHTEAESTITLVEGKVRVSSAKESHTLLPGEQAITRAGYTQVQLADVDQVLAWTRGEFMFTDEQLGAVMEDIARWYNIEVEISPELREVLVWGSLSRYEEFTKAMDVIRAMDDDIEVVIEGRRVRLMK